jgi:hypothetical protein
VAGSGSAAPAALTQFGSVRSLYRSSVTLSRLFSEEFKEIFSGAARAVFPPSIKGLWCRGGHGAVLPEPAAFAAGAAQGQHGAATNRNHALMHNEGLPRAASPARVLTPRKTPASCAA